MSPLHAVVALVALQRAGELVVAAANTRHLRIRGAVEIDRAGYPWLVALHVAWLAALWLLPSPSGPYWPPLVVYGLLQFGRIWAIASLGRRWTTRIIVLPGVPPLRNGPYRWLSHPNYLVVAGEIALLPLAFGSIAVAVSFSIANVVLIARRIAIEDRALARSRQDAAA